MRERGGCATRLCSLHSSDAIFPETMLTRNSLTHFGLRVLCPTLLSWMLTVPMMAQSTLPPTSLRNATRAQIDSMAGYLDRLAASTAYGQTLRERARSEAV